MTRAEIEARVENLNRRLQARGSRYRWQAQGRSGQTALDRYEGEKCVSLIAVGTKREIGDFLHAAMVALDDAAAKGAR